MEHGAAEKDGHELVSRLYSDRAHDEQDRDAGDDAKQPERYGYHQRFQGDHAADEALPAPMARMVPISPKRSVTDMTRVFMIMMTETTATMSMRS
jgi:hypothetical protein